MKVFIQYVSLDEHSEIEELNINKNDTIISIFKDKYNLEFDNNKVNVYINNDIVKNGKEKLKEGDLITITTLPKWNYVLMIVINIAIGFILRYLYPTPDEPDTGVDKTIYSSTINQIKASPGSPIQLQYGEVRTYPKLIANTYSFYDNNVEKTVIHTCAGIDELELKQIFLGETKIEDLPIGSLNYYKLNKGIRTTGYDTILKNYFNDDRVRYITHKASELFNLSLNNLNDSIGEIVINKRETKINKILINYTYAGGINTYDDSGNILPANVYTKIEVFGVDDDGNKNGYHLTKTVKHTAADKNTLRFSEFINVPEGRYSLKITRTSEKIDKGSSDLTIKSVFGFDIDDNLNGTEDLVLMSFVIVSNKETSGSSSLNLNINTQRKKNGKELKTLRDAVEDIWTDSNYGLNLKLDFLEIRDELNYSCDFVIEKKENGYNILKNLLKSYGFLIYPYMSKFIIEKDTVRPVRQYLFTSENCIDISYSYNLPSTNELKNGIKANYLKKGEANVSEIYFPEDADSYDQIVLTGISDEITARDRIINMYNKRLKLSKMCKIKTSVEGFIPEIGSRCGVASDYLKNNITVIGVSISGNTITLEQNVELIQGYGIMLADNESNISKIYTVVNEGFTNQVQVLEEIEDLSIYSRFGVTIGEKTTIVEDFLLVSVSSSEINEDLGKPIELELTLQEYKEEVY